MMAYNHMFHLYVAWLSAKTPVERYNAMCALRDFQLRKLGSP